MAEKLFLIGRSRRHRNNGNLFKLGDSEKDYGCSYGAILEIKKNGPTAG